jgi:hypothetical protein
VVLNEIQNSVSCVCDLTAGVISPNDNHGVVKDQWVRREVCVFSTRQDDVILDLEKPREK